MSIKDYVPIRLDGQLFGLDAAFVRDVFHPRGLTPVPLSSREVYGLLNHRGRIVTAVCARRRLGLPDRETGGHEPLAIGLHIGADSYGLVIDSVGEVLKLDEDKFIAPQGNLPPRWADVIVGVYQLNKELMIALNPLTLLDATYATAA